VKKNLVIAVAFTLSKERNQQSCRNGLRLRHCAARTRQPGRPAPNVLMLSNRSRNGFRTGSSQVPGIESAFEAPIREVTFGRAQTQGR
jgi:hypothetical protein